MLHSPRALFEFQNRGRAIFIEGLMLDLVANEQLPVEGSDLHRQHVQFLSSRGEKAFGKWPVHIIFPGAAAMPRDQEVRFTGVRVFASGCSFSDEDLDMIEKLIVIWHQEVLELAFPRSVRAMLAQIPWAELAEKVDY